MQLEAAYSAYDVYELQASPVLSNLCTAKVSRKLFNAMPYVIKRLYMSQWGQLPFLASRIYPSSCLRASVMVMSIMLALNESCHQLKAILSSEVTNLPCQQKNPIKTKLSQ